MATKMNCTAVTGDVVQPALARSGSSHTTTSRAKTSGSAARDEEEDDDDDDDVDARLPDEMVLSDLVGGTDRESTNVGHASAP